MNKYFIALIVIVMYACKSDTNSRSNADELGIELKKNTVKPLFELKSPKVTGVYFSNQVKETFDENYLNYEFIYNGSGLAVGDINNDGLPDLYFAGNTAKDALYLNKGNFEFEDISTNSGIQAFPGWSTGVSMIDINADGWLDIYVSRSGPSKDENNRTNMLFINNQDNTFTEQAEKYGLKSSDYTVQTAFFDYDLDGDLDAYMLNHPVPGFKAGNAKDHMERIKAGSIQSDRFYENQNGIYVEKSKEANLVNFGYRHGIAIGDINSDGYPDIYISSDFEEPDLMLINNGNKSFTNQIDTYFNHISFNSMGNEMVDINNDGLLDIYVVDMAPDDHFRSKAYMKSMDVERFNNLKNNGYHYQYMFNTLQLNRGNNTFSEIGQMSGTAKTDWSWAPLFFDMDLDGYKDLFITNGIKENFLFRDIQVEVNKKQEQSGGIGLQDLLDIVPSDVSKNVFYKNLNGVKFKDMSESWSAPSYFNSNGAVTADLDNDGDLDLITNNMESPASIYESLAVQSSSHNFIKLNLEGDGKNPQAIGAKVKVITSSGNQVLELYTSRGYLSSVDTPLVFGIGKNKSATVHITWPDGTFNELKDVKANSISTLIKQELNSEQPENNLKTTTLYTNTNQEIDFVHAENTNYNDYGIQVLLPHAQSNVGPALATADLNNDGLDDFYIGGAKGQSGALFLQSESGSFNKVKGPWAEHANQEDTGALFFDADNDGDLDLYVVSGGAYAPAGSELYADRLYTNNGKGNFVNSSANLPEIFISGKVVVNADVDNDGDQDLFIGGRLIPEKYPYAPKSFLLLNNNGTFNSKEIADLELVSGAVFSDYDQDGDSDLLAVGEWSNITVLSNTNGEFKKEETPSLENTRGLWFSLAAYDIDNDGDQDYFAGNLGLNAKFKVSAKKEFHVYCDDFDANGTYDLVLSGSYKGKLVPTRGRECSSQQMPFIAEKFTDYRSFAGASLEDIYGEQLNQALHYQANLMASMFIENLGDGTFKLQELPWESQLAPVQDFEFIGNASSEGIQMITVGNLFNVEVETPRYDASMGAILSYSKSNGFKSLPATATGFYASNDARIVTKIKTKQGYRLLVTNNNGALQYYKPSR